MKQPLEKKSNDCPEIMNIVITTTGALKLSGQPIDELEGGVACHKDVFKVKFGRHIARANELLAIVPGQEGDGNRIYVKSLGAL